MLYFFIICYFFKVRFGLLELSADFNFLYGCWTLKYYIQNLSSTISDKIKNIWISISLYWSSKMLIHECQSISVYFCRRCPIVDTTHLEREDLVTIRLVDAFQPFKVFRNLHYHLLKLTGWRCLVLFSKL